MLDDSNESRDGAVGREGREPVGLDGGGDLRREAVKKGVPLLDPQRTFGEDLVVGNGQVALGCFAPHYVIDERLPQVPLQHFERRHLLGERAEVGVFQAPTAERCVVLRVKVRHRLCLRGGGASLAGLDDVRGHHEALELPPQAVNSLGRLERL